MHGEERNGKDADGEAGQQPKEQQQRFVRVSAPAFVFSRSRAAADQPGALDEEVASEVSAEEEDEDGRRFALQLYGCVGAEIA